MGFRLKTYYKNYTMINETYDYIVLPNKTFYAFRSDGQKGGILKGVLFSPITKNLWNLAFGDIINGDINDTIISNNLLYPTIFLSS